MMKADVSILGSVTIKVIIAVESRNSNLLVNHIAKVSMKVVFSCNFYVKNNLLLYGLAVLQGVMFYGKTFEFRKVLPT